MNKYTNLSSVVLWHGLISYNLLFFYSSKFVLFCLWNVRVEGRFGETGLEDQLMNISTDNEKDDDIV